MTTIHRPLASLFAVLVVGLVLAGCAATVTERSGVPNAEGLDIKDHTTSSDESDAAKRARTRMDLASAYFSRNQMTTALDEVKKAIVANPQYGEAYNLRGLIYANLGDTALAEDSFKRSLQINPRDPDALHNYGFYLCQQKRYPESFALFARALAVPSYQGVVRTLLAQGICQAYDGQMMQAEGTLTRAYELDTSNPFTATNLSQVLYDRGEFERARFYIRRVNAMPGVSNAQTLWLAARIENKLGNRQGTAELGAQLRNRFPESRETAAFARDAFDE